MQARARPPQASILRQRTAASPNSLRLSPRRQFVAFLLLTALLGTTFSIVSVSPTTTAFRSRLPAHTLTKLTSKEAAFPVPSLPYFADKVSRRVALAVLAFTRLTQREHCSATL